MRPVEGEGGGGLDDERPERGERGWCRDGVLCERGVGDC